MEAEKNFASVGIELTHGDLELQQLFFEQLHSLQKLLESETEEKWDWELHHEDEFGKITSRVRVILHDVNVMNEADWPELITFLKPRIIALDAFWTNVKPAFEE